MAYSTYGSLTDGTDVLSSLTGDDFGGQGRECGEIQGSWVGLLREPGTLGSLGRRGSGLLHRGLERLLIERLLVVKVLGVGGIEVGAAREGLVGEIAVGSHIEKNRSRVQQRSSQLQI